MFPLGVSSGSNHWVSTGLDAAVTNLQHLRWMFSICCFCLDFSQSLHTICFELWAHSGANGSCANEMEFVWSHDLIDAVLCLVSTKLPLFFSPFCAFSASPDALKATGAYKVQQICTQLRFMARWATSLCAKLSINSKKSANRRLQCFCCNLQEVCNASCGPHCSWLLVCNAATGF